MPRRARPQAGTTLLHVTARGNTPTPLFADGLDRERFLDRLADAGWRSEWKVGAYCVLGTHYHLLVETDPEHLARGLHLLHLGYARDFNRRHGRVGHVFRDRYAVTDVTTEAHALEVARYIVLNPVRAGLADTAADWPWSSFKATTGESPTSRPVDPSVVLGLFDGPGGIRERRQRFRAFVESASGVPSRNA